MNSYFQHAKSKMIYWTIFCLFITYGFYLYRYGVISPQPFYIASLIFAELLLVTSYLVAKKRNNPQLAAILILISGISLLIILQVSAGGVRAPGLVWWCLVPVITGTFFGRKASTISFLLSIFVIGVFSYIEVTNPLASIFTNEKEILLSKIINTVVIVAFGYGHIYYLIKTIEITKSDVEREHNVNETLLRILVHDLSTPLQVMGHKVKKIRKNNEHTEDDLVKLEKGINTITNLIKHVRTLNAVDSGKISLNISPVNTASLIDDVSDFFEYKLKEKNIKLLILNKAPNELIQIDSIIFKNEVLNNIISNAIKFSYPESEIKILVESIGEVIKFTISDQGVGIKNIKKLFNPKEATSTKGTSGETGTGFGVLLVKSFVDKMGGTFFIESSHEDSDFLNHGTKVTITFPAYSSEDFQKAS